MATDFTPKISAFYKLTALLFVFLFQVACTIDASIFQQSVSQAGQPQLKINNTPTMTQVFESLSSSLSIEVLASDGSIQLDPVDVTVEVFEDPTGTAVLVGTRTVTTINGIADFSALALDLPGNGYQLKFYLNDNPNIQVVSEEFDVQVLDLTVAPFFPLWGRDFMNYVYRDETKKLHEQIDQGDPAIVTFHGGEMRKIALPALATCNDLVISELLDTLHWECYNESGQIFIYSKTFKDGKGIRDLITANSFRDNKVTIQKNGVTVAESTLSNTWWTNNVQPIALMNSGASDPLLDLSTEGTIYTLSASSQTRGIRFNNNKVALVTLSPSVIISNTPTLAVFDCNPTAATNADCMILGTTNYGWIEATFSSNLNNKVVALGPRSNSFLPSSNNWRIHNTKITTTGATSTGIYTSGTGFKITDTTIISSGTNGIHEQYGNNGTFENVRVNGGGVGLDLTNLSVDKTINRARVTNTSSIGIKIDGFFSTLQNSNISNNTGIGVRCLSCFTTAIQNNIISNNTGTGLSINGSFTVLIAQNVFRGNGKAINLFEDEGSSRFLENNYFDKNTDGIEFNTGFGWTLSNNIFASTGNTAIRITGTSNDFIWKNKLILNSNFSDCSITTTGLSPGLTAGCENQGASTANIIKNVDTLNFLTGSVSDTANPNSSGVAVSETITDWQTFQSPLRNWIRADASGIGRCTTGILCHIFDYTLSTGALEALFVNGVPTPNTACPTSIHGNELNQGEVDFLKNATEVYGDFIGNDNGFCESNEACMYAPHIGAYQGDESLPKQSCTFQNGTNLQNIKIYYYPESGS